MTATSRKVLVIVLLLIGTSAAVAVPSEGVLTTLQAVLLAIIGVLSFVPDVRGRVIRGLDAIREPTPRRQGITAIAIALASSGYLLLTGLYQQRDLFPKYHDEHMHLVQMQLIAHGTLWRAPHPLAEAFETFHVLTEPVYASIYFPGTALLYAPAVWLNLPWWLLPLLAAGASAGLLYHVVTDLLDGAYGALSVALMLSATQFRYLSLIVMSHLVMILLGLVLVWAYLRWRRRGFDWRWALVIGVVAGWAAITRPVDAICWAAPVGLAMLLDLRGAPLRRWLAVAGLLIAGAAPFLALQVVFNWGVTGNPLMTPYRLSADLFTPQISFGFHDYDPTVRPKTQLLQKLIYYDTFTVPAAERHKADTILQVWMHERLPDIVRYTLPRPLPAVLIFAGVVALSRVRWVLWGPLPLFIAAYALFAYFIPNYIAVYTGPVVFAVLLGVRAVIDAFPRFSEPLTMFLFCGLLAVCVTSLPETSDVREDNRPTPAMELNSRLDDGVVMVDGRPQKLQKPAIVLIKYRPSENPHEEPVYTIDAPWPDESEVIRAHDLGTEKNLELLHYYAARQPDRHVYFFDRANGAIRYVGQAGQLWTRLRNRPSTTRATTSPATTRPAP